MAKIDFGGVVETVVTRKEYPLKKAQKVLKDEVIAIIGYGVQGPAQALNMRDNGINVIIGQDKRFAGDWKRANRRRTSASTAGGSPMREWVTRTMRSTKSSKSRNCSGVSNTISRSQRSTPASAARRNAA